MAKESENLVEISLVCEGVGLSCRLHIHVMISFEHVESGKKMLALLFKLGRLADYVQFAPFKVSV